MDSKQTLDLSKFPKIIQPAAEEQKLEVERRSKGIIAIKDIMENLLNVLQSYLVDLQALDSQAKILEQQKNELIEIDKQVHFSHHELEIKEKGIDEQLKFIEVRNKELKEQQLTLNEEQELFKKESQEKEKELIVKENELNLKEIDINNNLKKVQISEEKLKEMDQQQMSIDRSVAVDRERKALLDAREEKILQREARLQRLETDSRVG